MTDIELVEADWKKNNSEFSLQKCLDAYTNMRSDADWFWYRAGDTMMLVRRVGEHHGVFHFVNAARMEQFIDNVIACGEQCKADGFREITTIFSNPKILQVVERTPFKHFVVFQNMQYTMRVEL